jgi:hypothetical protein
MDSDGGSRKQRLIASGEGVSAIGRRCLQCHRAGAMPSHSVGLCEDCNAAIAKEVQGRVRGIQASLREVKAEASLRGKLRLWDLILAQAQTLLRFEERGILTTCPRPSVLLQELQAQRDALTRPR